jgi:hypothetical protein
MDTQMPEASEPSYSQRKRMGEKTSGSRNKVKAHRKPLETSRTTDDFELIATTVEDQLSEVWENDESHRASIMEKIQKVKTMLEKSRIRVEQSSKDKPAQTKEGVLVVETMKITVQGSAHFIITPKMMFINE